MKKVCIMGCGRVGATLAAELSRNGDQVLILDTDPTAFRFLPDDFVGTKVVGNGIDLDVLRKLGIEGELLQAREAGHAIVDEAMERNIDLILMGAEHKAPLGEYQMGRLTQYVLRAAPCNVWLWRHPVRE